MRVNIIAFALGVWLLQQQAQLPSLLHLTLICITAAALFGLNEWLKTRASRAFPAVPLGDCPAQRASLRANA